MKLHLRPRSALEQAELLQPSLQDIFTPVQFQMTVLSHVGDEELMANWVTVEHLMQIHLLPRAALEQAELLQPSLLESLTPVQFLMTVLSHVGVTIFKVNWAMVEHLMKLHLRQRVVLEQAVLLQPSLQDIFTPVLFSMMVLFHVGETDSMDNWATVGHLLKLHLRPQAVLEQAELLHCPSAITTTMEL